MNVEITLEGTERFRRIVKQIPEAHKTVLADAVRAQAQQVMNESKKLVPVDTGALKTSGQVSPPKISNNAVEVELSYGGPAAPYALIVHEDPTARHSPGKTYKYLEMPVAVAAPYFFANVLRRFHMYIRRMA